MGELDAIEKKRKNPQGYFFRGIDDVTMAMKPILSKHGVFFTPSVQSQIREERLSKGGGALIYTVLSVEFTFYAEDGSSVKAVTVGEAMDSGDKSANKAMSAALKYALLETFCIPTEEDKDTENNNPDLIPSTQKTAEEVISDEHAKRNSDPAEYIMGFGKYKGQKLDQIDICQLNNYFEFLKKGDKPSRIVDDTLRAINRFLHSREVSVESK